MERTRERGDRVGVAVFACVSLAVVALLPASASAATAIGQTFTPGTGCGASTFLQSTSPGGSYAAPASGVVTSWSYQADAAPPAQLRLKVGRSAGGDNFLIVGQSNLEGPAANSPNSYPTRISILAGDVIGLYQSEVKPCGNASATGFNEHFVGSTDVQPSNSPSTFTPLPNNQLDIAAAIEPDADQDGFGDETQDQCPTDPSTQGPCPAPLAAAPTGQRAAALKRCKKKFRANPVKLRKCRKKARSLPV